MRLSTHLDPEALAKLAAFKREQKAAEAPAPKPAASAGPASMMRAIAAASAVQPRTEIPQPPTQPKKKPRQSSIPRRSSRAAVVPAGSPAALEFEEKFEQSRAQFIVLRHIRRELGVSSAEIHELAEFNSVPIFEEGRELYIYRSDLKFIERAHQRRGGLVSLRTVGGSFNIAIKTVLDACRYLKIYSVLGPDGDTWISSPDYVWLRKHLQKKSAPANERARKQNHKAADKTKKAKMPEGIARPALQSTRTVFETWSQGEGKRRLNEAKSSTKAGYAVVISGGLPTLGRGHK